jgi:hypothetical protein
LNIIQCDPRQIFLSGSPTELAGVAGLYTEPVAGFGVFRAAEEEKMPQLTQIWPILAEL